MLLQVKRFHILLMVLVEQQLFQTYLQVEGAMVTAQAVTILYHILARTELMALHMRGHILMQAVAVEAKEEFVTVQMLDIRSPLPANQVLLLYNINPTNG
jgi:hypothetical protein